MHFTAELITSLAALFVSGLAVIVSIAAMQNDHKQKKITNLVTLYKFLHADEMSDARREVREATVQLQVNDPSVRRVCSGFDFAGNLVRNKAVDQDLFLDHWCIALMLINKKLRHVETERTGDGIVARDYYKDFFLLLDEAQEHKTSRDRAARDKKLNYVILLLLLIQQVISLTHEI